MNALEQAKVAVKIRNLLNDARQKSGDECARAFRNIEAIAADAARKIERAQLEDAE